MKPDVMKVDLFRPDVFSIIFILSSVAGSFFGEFVFRLFGLYADRVYDKSLYFKCLLPFLLIFVCYVWQTKCRHEKYRRLLLERGDLHVYNYILSLSSILFFAIVTPFELYYLKVLYSSVGAHLNFDAARVELQGEMQIIPKLFFYSSFATGLSLSQLLLQSASKRLRTIQIIITVIQAGVLVLFGSKSLILIPILASVITVNMYSKIQITMRKIILSGLSLVAIIVGSAVYTNLRSTGVVTNGVLVVDAMATFMPEQRDGAFLMDQESNKHQDPDFYSDNVMILVASATHRKIFEMFFFVDIDGRIKKKFLFKDLLSYNWEGGTARVGIIADAYVFAGLTGVIVVLLSFLMGIACLLSYLYFKCKRLHGNYFVVLIFINFVWTFNSDYIIQLPFVSSIVYFYLFWSILVYVVGECYKKYSSCSL